MDDAAAVSELLDDRPDLESPLRDVFEVDAQRDGWTFEDVPVDSGVFGELVSRDLVTETDDGDGYQIANPAAVRAALDENSGGPAGGSGETDGSGAGRRVSISGGFDCPTIDSGAIRDRLRGVDRITAGALAGALLVVVVARAFAFGSVFRDGAVVLSGNDPYYYRYWVEQTLAASGDTFDLSALATISDELQTGEPLLVATLWAGASLFGGDTTAAGWVLAWYPVVAAVITALLVYLLAMAVTEDRRVALAAVLLLAVTPAHAFRTSIGFADHHAFDYVWLALTAYALVQIEETVPTTGRVDTGAGSANDPTWRDPRRWLAAAGLGFAATGQVLAWDASPLLLAPLGLYAAARVLDDVRAGRSPATVHLPLVAGLGLAAVLVVLVHTVVGWHSGTVAYAPVLLIAGVVGVVGAGELAHRFDRSARELAGVEAVGAGVGVFGVRSLFPAYWADALTGIRVLTEQRNIAEVQSLLSGDAFGWLLLFGFVLVLAVPYLAWASSRAYLGVHEWLVPAVYCWYFLTLAVFQVRFAGQLSLFAAVFAGLGFVHLAARVDLVDPPVPFAPDAGRRGTVRVPELNTLGSFALLFLLVGGLSLVQVPVKTSQVTTDGDAYATAAWIDQYADEQGWSYPDNYVFSQWGKNRMYNYFVNGEAKSYAFAQTNFGNFTQSTDGEKWYQRLRDRVGFVVVGDRDAEAGSIHDQLSGAYGGRRGGSPGLSHYRAVYESDGGRTVFTLVPGATLTGASEAGTLTTGTDVRIDGATFTYERATDVQYGVYEVAVPYPGNYSIGGETVRVTEADLRAGATYELFDGPGIAHWTFDEGNGSVAYDRWGGNHVRLEGTTWTANGVGFGNGSSAGYVENGSFLNVGPNESLTVQMTIQGDFTESQAQFPTVFLASGDSEIRVWARDFGDNFGARIVDSDGTKTSVYGIDDPDFAAPTEIRITLNREVNELRMYRNGSLVGKAGAQSIGALDVGEGVRIGTGWGSRSDTAVTISDLRAYNSSEPPDG